MNETRMLTEADKQLADNVFHAMETIPLEEVKRLVIEFADYLTTDHGNVKVVYPDGIDIEGTSMMISSRYLRHEPVNYLDALKIDYLMANDDEGRSSTRMCLKYALRLLPKKYPDVLTMEQDSTLRKELMANTEALETELKALDYYKESVLSKSQGERHSSNSMEQIPTESVPLVKRFLRFCLPSHTQQP